MNKKIVKVIVFYEDGTFSEMVDKQTTTPVTDPLDKDFPWPKIPVVTTPCAKCGAVSKYKQCFRQDCPTGWGTPWDNTTTVTD